MKKRIIILSVAAIICVAIIAVFIRIGYFEYILDGRKIDRSNESHSVVVTLSIGPNVLIIKPYTYIIQIKSDMTITDNTFREVRRTKNRTFGDKIIKGRTRTLSEDEYDTLLEILRSSDFNSIQHKIDKHCWTDGNYTYISIRDDNGLGMLGGHCAENSDERFKYMMDYILGLLE